MMRWTTLEMITFFVADCASVIDPNAERSLSPLAKAFIITGLALAAWVPVLLPLYLIVRL
jgi:hypothetical protein